MRPVSGSRLSVSSVSVLALVAGAVLGLPAAATAQDGLSVSEVMSAPFPSELTAAPGGGTVAWALYEEGVRNVYVAGAPDYRGRRLTPYTRDDGQAIGDVSFTATGDRVVYVRGGSPNDAGLSPNPTNAPGGQERAIWSVSVSGDGDPVRLAEGHSPVPSPAGSRVAFVRDGDLWLVPAAGDGEPRRAVREKGSVEEIRWSPAGDRIAFVTDRGEHAFVAIHEPGGEAVTYLDPGLSEDRSPVWSPDGRRVAFIRVHPSSDPPYSTDRTGPGWELRVADAGSGEGRVVWSAPEGRGSAFYPLAGDRQLFWSVGGNLIFPWERDGWRHLYAVPVDGGDPDRLTPGEGIVESATLDPDRETLLYTSNIGDIDRRHVWRVPADGGGEPRQLTSDDGIQWSPVVASGDGAVAYLASGARRPGHARIDPEDGEDRALAPQNLPEEFPGQRLVEPEPVTLSGADGKRVRGQLFTPPGAEAGDGRPAVLFLHGGSRRQMLLGWHYMRYYHNSYAMNQYLASRGYVVLSLNYRSGIGYGLEFREARRWGARGASEFLDVLGAGLWLRDRPEVDGDRIGLYGGSYGGYLTALGLARASDLFAAGADFHGVHDWNIEFEFDGVDLPYAVDSLESVQQLAWRSSPMAWTDGWSSPVLFVHGDDDRTVPFRESVRLAERLRARGVPFEEFVIPGDVHDFLMHRHWVEAYRRTADFFRRELKGRR
ncbi:MAG: prolyl oligopeptidase family serine peptidase [Candidatus Palauibacterales bacterium]|nr:prolyl oligopeptidase family serine peptidase [Candidatus Palauibacterales bacterium]